MAPRAAALTMALLPGLLAWVFVGERMLNEELVRAGLSPAKVRDGYYSPYRRRLRAAEDEAKAAELGIWSLENPPGAG